MKLTHRIRSVISITAIGIGHSIDREDVLYFGGLLLMGIGCWMIYRPAGFLVVGFGMSMVGLGWGPRYGGMKQDEKAPEKEVE